MSTPAIRRALPWLALVLAAGVPRILGALFLPNLDRDANSYVEEIAELRASMAAGTFSIKDLAGFWLPMYQTVCAAGSLVVNNPLYVAKVVSATCGTGTCLLVFLICRRLTGRNRLACAAFALIAFNPLHIMYSSFSMTEVPYSLVVVGSLFFTIEDRMLLAAVFAMLAGLMRVEAWMLVVLIPALQLLAGRKSSPASYAVLVLGPLICFYIYWAATGNPFDYFHSRADYIHQLLVDQPELRDFTVSRIAGDAGRLLYSVNPLVLIGSMAAAWLMVVGPRRNGRPAVPESVFAVSAACVFFFSFLIFLLTAYLTNNQPQIWTRYGLFLFAIGAPIMIWASATISARAPKLRRAVGLLTIGACLLQWGLQLHDAVAYARGAAPQRPVAEQHRDP
jgi:hypothetical protein